MPGYAYIGHLLHLEDKRSLRYCTTLNYELGAQDTNKSGLYAKYWILSDNSVQGII